MLFESDRVSRDKGQGRKERGREECGEISKRRSLLPRDYRVTIMIQEKTMSLVRIYRCHFSRTLLSVRELFTGESRSAKQARAHS